MKTLFDIVDKETDYGLTECLEVNIADALFNYLIHGLSPGGCVTSMLANDLYLAAQRAHPGLYSAFVTQVKWIVYNVPDEARGSYEAVDDWLRDKDGRRAKYTAAMEKQYLWKTLKE